ncbi:hypothetical protein TWF730_008543 [Orbilia blumenaviensis]|uniref:Uncharacterized protein n=1 Tax=Orbilia blumenaviensis TaxID=1796055 RepID=A0AAV9V2Z0_9PEZI
MSHINIPHPSPRSSIPSTSPIHLSSPSSDGWKHIISVAQAFSDRLSQLPHDTPVATNRRWSRRCHDKGITGTKASTTEVPTTTTKTTAEKIGSSPVSSPVASTSADGANDDTQPKRRRGRPAGSTKKLAPPAIVAAKRNLRRISQISDQQWGHKEPEVANETPAETATQDEDIPLHPRRSTRSTRQQKEGVVGESPSHDKIASHRIPVELINELGAELEGNAEPEAEISIEATSEPRQSRKQPAPSCQTPSTLFFFTVLPKPTPSHLARHNRSNAFTFSMQALSHRRTVTSDNVVMLCMRARVRKQKRMREAGITQSIIKRPQGRFLTRNIRVMERRVEKINKKKGKQVDRRIDPVIEVGEPREEQPLNENELDTSQDQIDIEEAETSGQKRGRKRKRIPH